MAIKRKKDIQKLSLDDIWPKVVPDYYEAQTQYKKVWGKKKRTMIILFILGILPGLIYWFFVWTRGAEERHSAANKFISDSLGHIFNDKKDDKSPFLEVKGALDPRLSTKLLPLPLGKLAKFHDFFSFKLSNQKAWDQFFKDAFYDTNPTPGTVSDILVTSGVLAEVTGRRTAGKAALKTLTSGFTKGTTISIDLLVETSANISMKLKSPTSKDPILVNLYNLKTTIIRQEEIVKEGKTERVETEDVSFSGIVASIDAKIDYKANLLLKTKTWDRHTNKRLVNDLDKLKYPLASTNFNDNFKLMVSKEEGPALRKAFQPRSIAALEDIAMANAPFVLTSTNNGGLVLAIEGLSKHDLPLFIENTGKFFKKDTNAKKMIEKDLQPLLSVATSITKLVKTKFIK